MAKRPSIAKKYGYLWITLIFFSGSIIAHWYYGFQSGNTLVENLRDTFENWQSEFLQLIWQVGGLAMLLHLGSPQSKEGDERKEEKIDRILAAVDKDSARVIAELDKKYPRS